MPNGSLANINQTRIRVADVNGTSTLVINGTLANGTTVGGHSSFSKQDGVFVGAGVGAVVSLLVGIGICCCYSERWADLCPDYSQRGGDLSDF